MPVIALAQLAACEAREANLALALAWIEEAGRKGADLICFPEMGFDRFFPQHRACPDYFDLAEAVPGPTVDRLQEAAREAGVTIVANLFERERAGEYYNCSPVIDGDGRYLGKSHMTHIAEAPLYNEKYYYRPGKAPFEVFPTRAGRVGIAICYDRHYPELLRILALRGCEILAVPLAAISREAWPVFEMEMCVASFQNQFFSIVVNRAGQEEEMAFVGRSFVTNPFGKVIARARDDEPELCLVEIDLEQIEQARRVIPHLRDRRPERYGPLLEE